MDNNKERRDIVLSCLTTKPLDDLLKIVGEFGKYQKIRLCMICLVSLLCAFHAQNMVFVGARPAQYCNIPAVNLSGDVWNNVTQNDFDLLIRDVPEDVGCSIRSPAETIQLVESGQYSFEELKSKKNITISTERCVSWTYSKEIYGSTIVSEFDLVCDKKWLTSTSKTLYFFGRLLGAIVFGQLADIFGRRIMFFVGLLMLLIVGCVASAAPNIYVFIPFYILQGAAQTGLFLVGFVMCTELVGPRYRLSAGFLVHGFYAVGYMMLALIGYLVKGWRYIELTISLPVIAFSLYICFLPESIRWLLSKDRNKEAAKIMKKLIATNKPEITEEQTETLLNKEEQINDYVEKTTQDRKYTAIDLVRPLQMAILSFNVWFNWLVNSFVYYGLGLGTEYLGGNPYINFCIAGAVQIPADILCLLLLNRLGRRLPLCVTMATGGIACIASGFVTKDLLALKITLAMIGKFMNAASYGIIYLCAAEVFPTVVRNAGVGVSSMSARIGGMLAPQVLELNAFWMPLPMIIFGGMSILAGFMALIIPETVGKRLPQTIEDITKLRKSFKIQMDEWPEKKNDGSNRGKDA